MVKYNELFRLLTADGWCVERVKGSHVVMVHPIKTNQLTVPNHGSKEVKKGLAAAVLKQAQIKTTKR